MTRARRLVRELPEAAAAALVGVAVGVQLCAAASLFGACIGATRLVDAWRGER